jgi:hypothetical protein
MSSLRFLPSSASPARRTTEAFYVAHRDGCRYTFTASWHWRGRDVCWSAEIRGAAQRAIARPCGAIDGRVLTGGSVEDWVRAAVELAIERLERRA